MNLTHAAASLLVAFTAMSSVGACAKSNADTGQQPPSGLLAIGAKLPDLSATDQTGKAVRLADYKGSVVVVYFYPKDATPGCTKEACAFRDVWAKYEAAGVKVLGVSADDQASHEKFANEHKLPFSLLADTKGEWVRAFGVPTRLNMATRVSFLLGKDGAVARVYPQVDPGLHAAQVLDDASKLGN